MVDADPVGIYLVTSGSGGDRLLFRYPFESANSEFKKTAAGKNCYAARVAEDYTRNEPVYSIKNGVLLGYTDDILANLLAVTSDLCGQPFNLTIDDACFVGYPVLLQHVQKTTSKQDIPTMLSFNVVFVLKASTPHSVITSYQELSKRLAIALRHEERRIGYLTGQKYRMQNIHDDMTSMPEDRYENPFKQMLSDPKCQLARDLRVVYESLCKTGVVQLYINKWIQVSFCLPHKVHNSLSRVDNVEPEAISNCLEALRPYHGLLLLVEEKALLKSLPVDSSPALIRLISVTSPLKSLQNLAADADLSLGQVFQLVSHLVYWAKARVIYPLCETNVYVLSPTADTFVNSPLLSDFTAQFRGMSLPAVMAEFSLPTVLGEHRDILGLPQQQAQQVQMVVWMLQRRLLMQLHTYIYLVIRSKITSRKPSSHLYSISDDFSDSGLSVVSDDSPNMSVTMSSSIPSESISEDVPKHDGGSRMSSEEREMLSTISAVSNPEDVKLLMRLKPYFNGNHHLEDIMYFENLRRSQLLTLIDKFRQYLVTCTHPDPATDLHVIAS